VTPPCLGHQPTMLYLAGHGQTLDQSGRCTPESWWLCYQGVHYQIITSKHVYLHILSLSYVFKIKWFEMRAPNRSAMNLLFYQYGGLCTGLRLILQNILVFLFWAGSLWTTWSKAGQKVLKRGTEGSLCEKQ